MGNDIILAAVLGGASMAHILYRCVRPDVENSSIWVAIVVFVVAMAYVLVS